MEGGVSSKVVFCATESEVDHIRSAFAAGADAERMKPFDLETLRAKFRGTPEA
jgi:two-component system chemotaxis response regulator CheY